MPRKCPEDGLGANGGTSGTSRPDLCAIPHILGSPPDRQDISTGQRSTGWLWSRSGDVPPNFFMFIVFFSSQSFKNSGESSRPLTTILLKCIAIHLSFLLRYFCRSMPPLGRKESVYHHLYHDTPPICIAILFQKSGVIGTPPIFGWYIRNRPTITSPKRAKNENV